jgi:Bacterial TniB protein
MGAKGEDLAHLHPAVRDIALQSSPDRIRYVKTAKWILYPRAQVALNRLAGLIDYPTCARMPCLLIYGDSGIGKTMITEKFIRDHPAAFDASEGIEHRPVVAMQMPPAPDEKRFYMKLLAAVGAPTNETMPLPRLESIALRVVRALRPRMIIIDEVHNLLAGSAREQRRALNLLKFLANELLVSIIACGTSEALHAMQSDLQIASRFEPFELPRWTESKEFLAFLAAYTKAIPLRSPSNFTNKAAVGLLLGRSMGITGYLALILQRAAEAAIVAGKETVSLALLDDVSRDLRLTEIAA